VGIENFGAAVALARVSLAERQAALMMAGRAKGVRSSSSARVNGAESGGGLDAAIGNALARAGISE
jgi:hypothetical protein